MLIKLHTHKIYLFFFKMKSLTVWQAKCQSFVGKLVEIETEVEDYFARSLAEE